MNGRVCDVPFAEAIGIFRLAVQRECDGVPQRVVAVALRAR